MKDKSYSISIGLIVVGVATILLAGGFILELIGAFLEGVGVWLVVDAKMRSGLNKITNRVVRFFQGKKGWE